MKKAARVLMYLAVPLIVVEFVLQYSGFHSGVLFNDFLPVDSIFPENRFKADELGVISYDTSCHCLPSGYKLNDQGYRGSVNFSSDVLDSIRKEKKIVLALGDSYTEGCCADPVTNSFIDLINAEATHYFILNFGVGSTSPIHYKGILSKYLDSVRPDLVLVNLYLGNDIIPFKMVSPPNIPQSYAFKNFNWISSTIPPYFQKSIGKTNFSDHIEAYSFYQERYTLLHDDVTFTEHYIAKSVILSRLYLAARNGYYIAKCMPENYSFTKHNANCIKVLQDISDICLSRKVEVHFSMIPSPKQAVNGSDLSKKYEDLIEGLNYSFPIGLNLSEDDFDGMETSNHYNNSGHRKHSKYLSTVLDSILLAN